MVHANVCFPSTGRSSSWRISAGFSRKTHEKQGLLERDLLERASSKQDPLKRVPKHGRTSAGPTNEAPSQEKLSRDFSQSKQHVARALTCQMYAYTARYWYEANFQAYRYQNLRAHQLQAHTFLLLAARLPARLLAEFLHQHLA